MFYRASFVILLLCVLHPSSIVSYTYSSAPYESNYGASLASHQATYSLNKNGPTFLRTFYDRRQNAVRPLYGGGTPLLVSYNNLCPYEGFSVIPCKASKQHYYACYKDCMVYAKCDAHQVFDVLTQFCQAITPKWDYTELPPCQQEGFFAAPHNCSVYYNCKYNKYQHVFVQLKLRCSQGQCFNPQTGQCECQPPTTTVRPCTPNGPTNPCDAETTNENTTYQTTENTTPIETTTSQEYTTDTTSGVTQTTDIFTTTQSQEYITDTTSGVTQTTDIFTTTQSQEYITDTTPGVTQTTDISTTHKNTQETTTEMITTPVDTTIFSETTGTTKPTTTNTYTQSTTPQATITSTTPEENIAHSTSIVESTTTEPTTFKATHMTPHTTEDQHTPKSLTTRATAKPLTFTLDKDHNIVLIRKRNCRNIDNVNCNESIVPKVSMTVLGEMDVEMSTCDDGNCQPASANTQVVNVNGQPLIYINQIS